MFHEPIQITFLVLQIPIFFNINHHFIWTRSLPSICGADGRWQTAGRLPFLDPRRGLLLGGLGHFSEETTNQEYYKHGNTGK